MANPRVVMETSMGTIEIELFENEAPISTKNFLQYVDENFYDGLIFHRIIPNFMVQGGGFDADMNQKSTHDMIKNEAKNGLKNDRGTLAMARTNVVDSASSQFFVNVVDNTFLNYRDDNNYGYAVFGKVLKGMEVMDKIVTAPSTTRGMHQNVPKEPISIISAKRA